MFRFLERSENTARLIEAGSRIALTRSSDSETEWKSIVTTAAVRANYMQKHDTFAGSNVVDFLLRDRDNPSSVISVTEKARTNARMVRTALTTETWEAVNESWMILMDLLKRPVRETDLPEADLVVLPGGFSFGDYLRSGAMAGRSPIMKEVIDRAHKGKPTLGICNGFQVLTETGLLPGALMRNAGLNFVCRDVTLKVEHANSAFTNAYTNGDEIRIPVAHHDGNFFADDDTLKALEDNAQVAFRYKDNPNGSQNDIAGIYNESRSVLGLMPHPERAIGAELGSTDGIKIFESLMASL